MSGRKRGCALQSAIACGRYGSQLQLLFKHFPSEQVLVLQMERCRKDSSAMLADDVRLLDLVGDDIDPQLWPNFAHLG
jgi:hypothetical protein